MFRSSKTSDGPSRLPSIRRAVGVSRSRPTSVVESSAQQTGDSDIASDSTASTESTLTSKGSKRRSLLPQFSRKSSKDDREPIRTIKEDEGVQEKRNEEPDHNAPVLKNGLSKAALDKQAMPPPAKPPSRPPSSRVPAARPTTSGKASIQTRPRTASKDARPPQGLRSTSKTPDGAELKSQDEHKSFGASRIQQPSSRPASSYGKPTSHGRTNSATVASSNATDRRPATSHVRNTTSTKPALGSVPNLVAARQRAKTQLGPASRPTFSTYQQHYSPAKGSTIAKPSVPLTKGPSKPNSSLDGSELPMTPELALEQIELLQLSLMHQESAQTLLEYEHSAENEVRFRHAQLCSEYELIREKEAEFRRLHNLEAIEAWCPDASLLDEYLQILSRVVGDLLFLTEPRSRFSDLVSAFNEWISNADLALDSPQPDNFTQALPETSRTMHTSLALKLRSVQRDLQNFPPPVAEFEDEAKPSSLSILLTQSNALVDDMLKILELMSKVQKDAQLRGKILIDEQISNLLQRVQESKSWTPAWQQVT